MPRAFLVKKERAQETSCCNRAPSSTNDLGFSISKITQNIDLCKQRAQLHQDRKDERGERLTHGDGQGPRISPRPQSSHSPAEVSARILASRPTLKSNKCLDPDNRPEIGKDSPSWTTSLPYLGGVFGKTSPLTTPFLFNNIGTNIFIRPESTKYQHHHHYHPHQQQQQQQEQQHHHLDDDCRSIPSSKHDVGTHPGILIPVPLSTMHPRFFPFHVSPADAHHSSLHHTSFSYPSLHHHDLHPPATIQSPGQFAPRPDYLTSKFFGGFQDSLGPSPLAVAGCRSLSAWPPVSSPLPGRPTPSGSPDSPSRSSGIHRTVVQDENSGSTEKEFRSMKNFDDVKRSKSNISPTTSDSRTSSISPPNFMDNLGPTGAVEQSNNADAEKSSAFSAHAQPEVQTYRSRPEPPPRFQCEACQKSYSTFNGLSKHKEFHCLSFVKKQFSCPHCDSKSYSSLGALKMHIRTHTLPCRCKLCGKAFSRPWLLQGHLRTHTGEKPFECPHCCRAFADRSNLRAHLQTHCDIKKYNCKTCAKTFSRMSLLLKHKENNCFGVIR